MEESGPTAARAYRPLGEYLQRRYADRIVLTFAQIEDLLGFQLPDGARASESWWETAVAPSASAQSSSWTGACRTATVNLSARCVLFERAEAGGISA